MWWILALEESCGSITFYSYTTICIVSPCSQQWNETVAIALEANTVFSHLTMLHCSMRLHLLTNVNVAFANKFMKHPGSMTSNPKGSRTFKFINIWEYVHVGFGGHLISFSSFSPHNRQWLLIPKPVIGKTSFHSWYFMTTRKQQELSVVKFSHLEFWGLKKGRYSLEFLIGVYRIHTV